MTENLKDLFVCAISAKIMLLKTDAQAVRDDCPSCGGEQTLHFRLTDSTNKHLRGFCVGEGCTVEFME